jgi:hypothetical protein
MHRLRLKARGVCATRLGFRRARHSCATASASFSQQTPALLPKARVKGREVGLPQAAMTGANRRLALRCAVSQSSPLGQRHERRADPRRDGNRRRGPTRAALASTRPDLSSARQLKAVPRSLTFAGEATSGAQANRSGHRDRLRRRSSAQSPDPSSPRTPLSPDQG